MLAIRHMLGRFAIPGMIARLCDMDAHVTRLHQNRVDSIDVLQEELRSHMFPADAARKRIV